MMMAKVDRPVLEPYSQGSMTLLLINSSTKIKPSVHSSISQPGATANANVSGKTAATHRPHIRHKAHDCGQHAPKSAQARQ